MLLRSISDAVIRRTGYSDPQYNVWDDHTGAKESSLTVGGVRVVRKDLRSGRSIRGEYSIENITDLAKFPMFKIGTGSKHIYETGDFMAEHTDSDQGKPNDPYVHEYTLLVVRNSGFTGGDLTFNGRNPLIITQTDPDDPSELNESKEPLPEIIGYLFPRSDKHAVSPVLSGTRVSFAFPVFVKSRERRHFQLTASHPRFWKEKRSTFQFADTLQSYEFTLQD